MLIETQLLYTYDQIMLALMIIIIMLGMGASLTTDDFRAVGRHYRGVIIGFLSQFGIMPLLAFGLSVLLNLSPEFAIALILIGCLPGGTTSNMFTYFARGSVALSIAMTTASTILALIMVPVLLELYAAGFTLEISKAMLVEGKGETFVIPVKDIVSSLLLVLFPVAIGMFLRYKSPSWAKTVEDTAGFFGIIVILYLISTALIRHTDLFFKTPPELYVAAICLGLFGFFFGYWMARGFLLPPIYQRAISLETGIQNAPVAFAIILLSFTDPVQSQMIWLAIIYATFLVATSSIVTLIYRKTGKLDYQVYNNTVIHNKLFGKEYITNYPEGSLPKRIADDPSQGVVKAYKYMNK